MELFTPRLATEDDLDEILKIEEEANPSGWSRNSFLRSIQNDEDEIWVLTDDETDSVLIGFMVFRLQKPEVHILELAIAQEHRRNSFGTKLLRFLVKYVYKQGVEVVHLEVRANNAAAVKFYQKIGFVIVHKKTKYYSNGDDAYSMSYLLSPISESE